jgi:ParB/RepB/Spo0J family partition protein
MAGLQGRQTDFALPYAAVATADVLISQLQPNPHHPRRASSDSNIELLADSLRQHGQLQPLWVRPLCDDRYEIIAGIRRWQAAQLADISSLSCCVLNVDDGEAFVLSLVENIQRQQLTPLEEAHAYQEMLDRGIASNRAGIARLLGVTRARITQQMKLLELDPATQQRLRDHPKVLTESHGRLLLEVTDLAERHRLADQAIALRWSRDRLKAEIEERRRKQGIERWQAGTGELPRAYVLNHTGISLRIDLMSADLEQQADIMLGVARKLQALAERRASMTVEGGAQEAASATRR